VLRSLLIGLTLAACWTVNPALSQGGASSLGAPLPQGAFSPLPVGTPDAAFAGSPLRLSPNDHRLLASRFRNDKVPVIPQPFAGQLDAALQAGNWTRVMARKADLGASRGELAMLMWEQTRFLVTGSLWLAELQARDLAASSLPGARQTAVLMWLYALATTMTDGHQCAGSGARDAHLASLRGPAFAAVLAGVRSLPDEELAAQRDMAIKLEALLAPERRDDTVCHTGGRSLATRPPDAWQTAAARTRDMLPSHLNAFCALVRGRPMPKPQPPAPSGPAPARPSAPVTRG
jgi:hypothetical protein